MGNELWLLLRRAVRRRRRFIERPKKVPSHRIPRRSPLLYAILVGLLVACAVIGLLELRLKPLVKELAARQINNLITAQINAELGKLGMDGNGFVTIHRDESDNIVAVTADMARVNLLRAEVVATVLDTISAASTSSFGIPLGSLFQFDLLWAKGPKLRIYSLTAGTVNAQMKSEFYSAGINQTLHRVLLEVTVPLSVLLPGGYVSTQMDTTVCLAETIIVGKVPQTYLNWGESNLENIA